MARLLGPVATPVTVALAGVVGAPASVTTRVAVFVPSVAGEKVTVTVQVPRGRIPTEQVVPLTENSGLAGVE